MQIAIQEARRAAERGEVPVGAVVVDAHGRILAQDGNQTEATHDPCAHAEIVVLRQAATLLATPRLVECDLYVTLEPCAMCAAAMSLARIRRLYFGAYDPKGGAVDHGPRWFTQPTCHHRTETFGGIEENANALILKEFFKNMRI